MAPDYRYFRAFEAAARLTSFRKAAAWLRISPSALSRQIVLLEESCGGELFVRNTRHVALTSLGQRLSKKITRFEQDLSELKDASPLRIGCLESVFEFFLADLILQNPTTFQGALDITIGSPDALLVQAIAGDLDLAITSSKPAPGASASGFPIFRENLTWIGTEEAKKGGCTRPILLSAFETYCRGESDQADRIRVNSFNATIAMTKRGIGRALVALPAGKKRGRHIERSQWIYAVISNYRHPPPHLRAVLSLLKKSQV